VKHCDELPIKNNDDPFEAFKLFGDRRILVAAEFWYIKEVEQMIVDHRCHSLINNFDHVTKLNSLPRYSLTEIMMVIVV
jgi:hypothetical protein